MTRRKNTKRIDPRYFLNETVNRNDEVLAEEDVPAWFSVPDSTKRRIARHDAEDRADKRQRDDAARRRQGVKDDIEMDKWKNRDRTHSQEHGEIEEQYNRPGRAQMAAQKDKLYDTMGVVRRELSDLIKLHRQEKYRQDPQTKPTLEILRNLMDNITREYTQDFPPRDGNEE
jgi:hypothetical protein